MNVSFYEVIFTILFLISVFGKPLKKVVKKLIDKKKKGANDDNE